MPVNTEAQSDLIPPQALEVMPAESWLKLPCQVVGVVLATLEHHTGTRIRRQRFPGSRSELGEVLVCEREAKAVSARFCQNLVEGLGEIEVVLELVKVEAEVAS